ncbi:MAG: 2-oxo acid dehydrogenase subunit E2 [Planctomycetes bacterium]|nr:2-oxo acid dehydrogenase subunit E2 [Planctomycetota bacterium]
MPISVTMPRLSDTMESGTIVRWNVKEGDAVKSGMVVADIETDKATMEMPVFDDGRISKLLVPAGQQVKVGTEIAIILEDGESDDAAPTARPVATAPAATPTAVRSAPAATSAARPGIPQAAPADIELDEELEVGGAKFRVSPVARRIAEQERVDLSGLKGSGPGGRIIKRDVLNALENLGSKPAAAKSSSMSTAAHATTGSLAVPVTPTARSTGLVMAGLQSTEVAVSSMRQTIAKRLVESKTTIPHYQVSMKFELDRLMALREQLNKDLAEQEIKLSVNDFIVRGCALSMAKHPYVNASWAGDRILMHQQVNIGVAVALDESKGGGLLVAVIRDVDRKSLRTISSDTKALSEKARTRGLSAEEMSESTFTVSNLGMFGVEHFTAIINPPNSAILACGAALKQPVVRGDELTIGYEMTATLSLDHRVIDGAMAARWLNTLKHLLENPATLLV